MLRGWGNDDPQNQSANDGNQVMKAGKRNGGYPNPFGDGENKLAEERPAPAPATANDIPPRGNDAQDTDVADLVEDARRQMTLITATSDPFDVSGDDTDAQDEPAKNEYQLPTEVADLVEDARRKMLMNANDDGHYSAPPTPPTQDLQTPPPAPPTLPPAPTSRQEVQPEEDAGEFREWEAANRRYQAQQHQRQLQQQQGTQIVEEYQAEDPFASPGNSVSSFGGWSVGTGMIEQGVSLPYDAKDEDEEEFDEDSDSEEEGPGGSADEESNNRASSPRQVQSTKHTLCMVKEEEEEEGSTSPGNKMFDDVDLEANTNGGGNVKYSSECKVGSNNLNLLKDKAATVSSNIRESLNNAISSAKKATINKTNDCRTNDCRNYGIVEDSDSNVTSGTSKERNDNYDNRNGPSPYLTIDLHRIFHEFRTNPNMKFKILMALSGVLVVSCLIAVSVAAGTKSDRPGSMGYNNPGYNRGGDSAVSSNGLDLLGTESITDTPAQTLEPTTSPIPKTSDMPDTEEPTTYHPTDIPTSVPTKVPTISPTEWPTQGTTTHPTASPTTSTPSYSPTIEPITFMPTPDCNDEPGEHLTYNGRLRTCEWLDNNHNGAESTRKELNCIGSPIGESCKYTCRLYNECMTFLLSSLSEYAYDHDNISVGNACEDKDGVWMSNGDVPRSCSWFTEDLDTAPMKKNMNCGTPDVSRTELGVMCPGSCAGYNDCTPEMVSGRASSSGVLGVNILERLPVALSGGGGGDEDPPTNFPTFAQSDDDAVVLGGAVESCHDEDGDFETHMGTLRQCRWLNRDGEDGTMSMEEKKLLNCGITEIGLNCLESCPCNQMEENSEMVPMALSSGGDSGSNGEAEEQPCEDSGGDYQTHMGTLRQCRWLNRDGEDETMEEKKLLNCGITEIGLNCLESCPCYNTGSSSAAAGFVRGRTGTAGIVLPQHISGILSEPEPTVTPTSTPTLAPTPHPATKGILDENGQLLTVSALADATIEQRMSWHNFGTSKRLNVKSNDPGGNPVEKQALLKFDLSYAKELFDTFGTATLSIYSVVGSDVGGVVLKKMTSTRWLEDRVTWNNIPRIDDGGMDEPTIAFVDIVASETWYEIDVTAAVKDALNNGDSILGIRMVSEDEDVDVYFGSRERLREPPTLVIDSRTSEPTSRPTLSPVSPTASPTVTPTIQLDCMDKKGTFETHLGTTQPCSWLGTGNGSLKKELNCQDTQNNAAALFCQAQCSEYNGCDDRHCDDKAGEYTTHTGWKANCSWLSTGQGTLKKEMNCGTDDYAITEVGKRCQASCGAYNGCRSIAHLIGGHDLG